ncbi:MAG: ABC transporter transmembrane domain-containing protein, partial [Ruminiclostridium sp.]
MKSILKENKLLISVTIILSIITSGAFVYIAIILQKVTDIALSRDLPAFQRKLIQSVLFFLILGLLNYIYAICSKRLVCNIIRMLRKKVFHGILHRNVQDFTSVNTADYLSAFTNDIKLVEDNYILPLLMILQNMVMFIGTLIVLFIFSPLISLCLIGFLIMLLVVPAFFGKALQKRQDRLSKTLSVLTIKIKDILSGYEVIKSYHMGNHIKSEFKKQNDEAIAVRFHSDKLMAASESLSEILAYLTIFSGVFIGAYLIILGNISAGTLLALIQLSSMFVNPLMIIMQCVPKIQGVKPILIRLEEFANYKDTSFTGTEIPSFDATIKVDGLCFSYDESHSVLNNTDLLIEKNKKYAIVGQSGCGKSTLVKLLSGNYYNFEGEISYDGKDIRKLDIEQLTNMISVNH